MPDSAEVLSEVAGGTKRKCLVRMRATSVMARARWARVSNHARYACAFLVMCDQCMRVFVMSHSSMKKARPRSAERPSFLRWGLPGVPIGAGAMARF